MLGALLEGPGRFKLSPMPTPVPKAGEVLVRLEQTGVCGSDVHLFLGHRTLPGPLVIGHEGLGQIVAVGEGVSRSIGERVVIEPNCPCGRCRFCTQKQGAICPHKRVLGVTEQGCFAEYLAWPEAFCWNVPAGLSDADAVTVEPMAVAYHALKKSGVINGETVLVIGLGAIGLLLTHLALAQGLTVWVLDPQPRRLQTALAMGAQPADVKAIPDDVAVVFECAGAKDTASLAITLAPRGAKVVLLGISGHPASFIPLQVVREGISILPSLIYDHPQDFQSVLDLIAGGIIRPGFIVSHRTKLEDIQNALEWAARGEVLKVVVTMGG